jgi:hypothetical protein
VKKAFSVNPNEFPSWKRIIQFLWSTSVDTVCKRLLEQLFTFK